MNYTKVYASITEKARAESRQKHQGQYFEEHHIHPTCMGGNDTKENLVFLTAREHFICHRLLTKIYPNEPKLKFAFWAMCNQKGDKSGDGIRKYRVTSKLFEKARQDFAIVNSKIHKGKKCNLKHIERSRKSFLVNNPHKKGKLSHLYGKQKNPSSIAKISNTKRKYPEKNGSYKGDYITPFGKFASVRQILESPQNPGYTEHHIRKWCKKSSKTVCQSDCRHVSSLIPYIGKTFADLGWGFQPKL